MLLAARSGFPGGAFELGASVAGRQVFPAFIPSRKTGKDLPQIEIPNSLLIAF
jgi:hypothetical protein